MICRTMPFSMIHNPDFKGTPLFDVEYLRNGAIETVTMEY